ncbi:hypothetical protein ES705_42653 [subsurface metagenome]
MKKPLFVVLVLLPSIMFSQNLIEDNFPTNDGYIYYSEVVTLDSSLTANNLYLNAKKWLVDAFKSSKAVIQADDKEAKLIIIKSYVSKGHNQYISNPKNWFTLKIEMKDGRYKYSLYDVRYEFDVYVSGVHNHTDEPFEVWIKPSDKKISEKKRQKINEALTKYCKELNVEFKGIISSLKKGMENIENDDW